MPRIVLGNRGSVSALPQARAVLAELSQEWPDVNFMQRTIQPSGDGQGELLAALLANKINIAVQSLEELPSELPDGLALAAVTKRIEPRCALIAKGCKSFEELPENPIVGVRTKRDSAFLRARYKTVRIELLPGDLDENLGRLASGALHALVVPSSSLILLDRRHHIDATLEADVLTPAAGQGSLGLVVRKDDDHAFELAYTMQHRPSFDRVAAERSFARAFDSVRYAVGALASVSSEGELELFGAVADLEGDLLIQAEVGGDASEAKELGRELAQDVVAQLAS